MFKIEGVDIDTYCWVHPSNISTLPQRWTEQLIEMNLPGTRVAAPDISGRFRMRITFLKKIFHLYGYLNPDLGTTFGPVSKINLLGYKLLTFFSINVAREILDSDSYPYV